MKPEIPQKAPYLSKKLSAAAYFWKRVGSFTVFIKGISTAWILFYDENPKTVNDIFFALIFFWYEKKVL